MIPEARISSEQIMNFLTTYYFTPVWVAGAAALGYRTYKAFKEFREGRASIGLSWLWGLPAAYTTGEALRCVADGIEKLL